MITPSKRSNVEPFRAMQVVGRANALKAEGRDIVMMCVGQPGSPAPSGAREAAREAIARGPIGYTTAGGIDPLRHRLAAYYRDKYSVSIPTERIIVTTGSSAGFILSFLTGFDVGARVAIPVPGYPAYRNILRSLSIEPVELITHEQDNWVVTPELLKESHKRQTLDGILIANPNNPNGTMMPPADFRELYEAAQELGITFISDEIYHGLTYTHPEISALEINDDVFVINSFSKYFCMTGWRIGWMIIPPNLVETVNRLQQNAFICAPEISQIAATAALDGIDEMERIKQGYEKNRELVFDWLQRLGLNRTHPVDGAFYAYTNVSETGLTSTELSMRLLEEAGVALTPGPDFDTRSGAEWVRLSFAGNYDELVQGFERMQDWFGSNL